jgi:hypothetical protein
MESLLHLAVSSSMTSAREALSGQSSPSYLCLLDTWPDALAIVAGISLDVEALTVRRPGKTLISAAGLPARVQIPVPPSATSRLLYELLGRVRLGFLVVSPFRIACVPYLF